MEAVLKANITPSNLFETIVSFFMNTSLNMKIGFLSSKLISRHCLVNESAQLISGILPWTISLCKQVFYTFSDSENCRRNFIIPYFSVVFFCVFFPRGSYRFMDITVMAFQNSESSEQILSLITFILSATISYVHCSQLHFYIWSLNIFLSWSMAAWWRGPAKSIIIF